MSIKFSESDWGSWNNWQQWAWNWGGIPPNTSSSAVRPGPSIVPEVVPPSAPPSVSSTDKESYGYTSFIDPAVPPSTIDYNHGAVPELSDGVSFHY